MQMDVEIGRRTEVLNQRDRTGFRFNLCKEGLNVFLHQLVQGGLFRPVPLIVNAIFSRRG